jgi:hypothetical protein
MSRDALGKQLTMLRAAARCTDAVSRMLRDLQQINRRFAEDVARVAREEHVATDELMELMVDQLVRGGHGLTLDEMLDRLSSNEPQQPPTH